MKKIMLKFLLLVPCLIAFACSSKENNEPKEKFEELKEEKCKSTKCENEEEEGNTPKERFEEIKDDYCEDQECKK